MKSLRKLFSEILDVKTQKLSHKSSPQNISEWDSVNNLILISEIEKEYGVVITIEDVYKLKSLGDVYEFIKSHGIKVKF